MSVFNVVRHQSNRFRSRKNLRKNQALHQLTGLRVDPGVCRRTDMRRAFTAFCMTSC
jgi:hypothetical protein